MKGQDHCLQVGTAYYEYIISYPLSDIHGGSRILEGHNNDDFTKPDKRQRASRYHRKEGLSMLTRAGLWGELLPPAAQDTRNMGHHIYESFS